MSPESTAPSSASKTLEETSQPAPRNNPEHDSTVRDIIASARRVPRRAPATSAWLLGAVTGVLFFSSFMPLDFSPLAWVALVPLLLLVRIPERTRWMYLAVSFTGIATMMACLQWMRLGDATMYPAWFLLATYCGLYFPMFVALSRVAVHRLRMPFTLAVPLVWTGLEYARATLMTGFGWYFLAHTQYRWLELIQISDLVGAYGVSFLIALTAATIAGLVPRNLLKRLKLFPQQPDLQTRPDGAERRGFSSGTPPQNITWRHIVSVAVCLTLFAGTLGYGYVRRSQADFQPGPRVALIQGNFISSVKHDASEAFRIFKKHRDMTHLAVAHQPDFIVWPETMHRDPLKVISPEATDADLKNIAPAKPPHEMRKEAARLPSILGDFSRMNNAAMIIGLETIEVRPGGLRKYNSAALSTPRDGYVGRYDKIHRVPFGEFVPFKKQFPWLTAFTPFPDDFGIYAGSKASIFEHRGYRATPVICFEDSVPHLVRRILVAAAEANENGRSADFLVNLTNDGWFHGSAELDQHLITALFRSVETRTPTVRAVNTGISAFIDGDGAVVEPEVFLDVDGEGRESMVDPETGRWHKSLNAVLVHNVPLDNRRSLYLQWGDWFAGVCAAFAGLALLAGLFLRGRPRAVAAERKSDTAA